MNGSSSSSSSTSTSSQGFNNNNNNNNYNNMAYYYQMMEEQINIKAKKMTYDWMVRRADDDDCGQGDDKQLQEQVFLVYKFINTPIDIIVAGMRTMMRE
jgi:hypothetical protein